MISNSTHIITVSFLAFLILIVLVGISSSRKAKKSTEDYLLASRDVHPLTTAISAISSLLSGFMFIGFIGFVYVQGLSAIIYPICWVTGDLTSWFFIHKPLRDKSQAENTQTIPSFIGTFNNLKNKKTIKTAAVITLIFLSAYAAVQFKVGGKALSTFMHWDESTGIILAAIITSLYCFSGGIRASLWTDVIQSVFMILSMTTLLVIGINTCGGFTGVFEKLNAIDPALTRIFPENFNYVFFVYFFSVMVNGFGVIGQPHVMVRPMLIKDSKKLWLSRNVYIIWYFVFSMLTIGVGLISRILMPELLTSDPESALPQLAINLLPSILVGFVLAGIFSAALSTADSQIISCTACITQDLFTKFKNSYLISKISTIFITIFAVLIALASQKTVFEMVEIAWSALATSIGVLLLLKCIGKKVGDLTGAIMMISGIITILSWKYYFQLEHTIHETLVGCIVALSVYKLSRFKQAKQ